MPKGVVILFDNSESRQVIQEVCEENGVLYSALEDLVEAEIEQTGKQKKKGLWDSFDDILDRFIKEE